MTRIKPWLGLADLLRLRMRGEVFPQLLDCPVPANGYSIGRTTQDVSNLWVTQLLPYDQPYYLSVLRPKAAYELGHPIIS